MDGSLLSPVVQLRNAFEVLPGFLRTPIEMVVFGGELPGADISGMRRMAAELRAHSLEMEDHSADIDSLLTHEDSLGETAEQLRETLGSYREGAAKLGNDVNALADQAQAAANDAEKWLCVMFTFGIHLAWKVYGLVAAATAAGPAGQVAAAPAVESTLIQGRAEVAVMRANLQRAIQAGGARAAAQLSGMGPAQFAKWMGTAIALPVGVEVGVQALQVATGDRTSEIIGEDGSNPTGIDLKSIEVAAVSGLGGAVGGMLGGRFASTMFPQIATSRVAMGLVHGTAGAIGGMGAAFSVAGWPQHYTEVLGPLLNGAFSGGVYAQNAGPPAIDGGAPFTPPDAIPAGHDANAAAPRQPIEVSAESKRAWASAQQTWKPAAEPAGERGGTPAEVAGTAAAAPPQSRSGQQASAPADAAGGRTPAATGGRATEGAAGRAPEGTGGRASGSQAAAGAVSPDAAAARPRSEAPAPVDRPQADKPGAAGREPAPRPVVAAGETSPPPKIPADARPDGGVPQGAGALAGEHAAVRDGPGNEASARPHPAGEHAAVPDGPGNEASARPHPADEGDAGSPDARAERGASGGEENATAQRDTTAEQSGQERPESSTRTETDGTDTTTAGEHSLSVRGEQSLRDADHDSLAEAAGLPRSDRDRAVDLLIDFNQASAEHVPESQRLSNLPDDVLKAGLHSGDEHQSMLATVELIRRGTISDAVPGGMVLRVEQAEAVYAMKSRPVEMKPGEGKSLVFMATAIQRAVHEGSVLLVTTTDGLANREVVTYEKLLTDFTNKKVMSDFGIDVFRADQENGFGPIKEGRPAIVVATGETVGHLCNAGVKPPRHVLIDEMDGIIDRGERQFLRSEGPEQAAPEETARQVFGADEFLSKALADGTLSHEDFGLRRIAEEIGVQADGTPELMYWYDGQPELTAAGRAKVEALPDGQNWLEGMGASRLETAANAEFLVRRGVHYEMDAGKIVIIDQAEHGLQRNPKTSSESRWSAEPGKASLAQAIEAKEIRAAVARGENAEEHRIVVRADADSAKRIDSVEIYRVGEGSFFDEVTGASGTLTDLNPVLQKIYGLEPAHEVGRSQTHRLVEGQHDVAESTHAKLRTIAEYANEMRDGGAGRFQEILCHRNDLVQRQVEALVRAGVPREAIEAVDAKRIAGWGADWESQLQRVFDEAGEQGKILVINRQGQRGVDISVSDDVKAMGGMHVWMTEAPEQSYIHEQAKNRTARNGQLGSAQVVMSPQDALIRNAMHLSGVREAVIQYDQAVSAHAADPTPRTHDAMVDARQSVRELVPELQERALRHSTADFIRHHAFSTAMPTVTLAEADTGQYRRDDEVDFVRPDGPADRTARLAGLLGIPAPAVADQITALERAGVDDPMRELLHRAGLTPAAAEAIKQHVDETAPAAARDRATSNDEDAFIHLGQLRGRLAEQLGIPIANIDGAEGMRTLDPLLTEARDALAATLGYPPAGITPSIARDILGEALGDHLPAANTAEPDTRHDTDSGATDSGPVGHDRQDAAAPKSDTQNNDVDHGTADDIVAAASQYLALSALLDSVVQFHRRSPNSCVNNAVTGMRVLCPDNIGRFPLPPTRLEGYGRKAVRDIFGAGLEKTGSLDEVAESLKSRPGGISVLVYKWKDTRTNGTSTEADDHMVLLVNDSTSVDEPNLVVVDLAASRDGNTENDYGPKDLRNRRTLLNRAVGFDDWRREQEAFINRIPADKRRFETIEFDRDGNLVSGSRAEAPETETLPPPQQTHLPSDTVDDNDRDGNHAPRSPAEAPDAETLPRQQRPHVSTDQVDDVESAFVGLPGFGEAVPIRPGAAGEVPNDTRRDEHSPVGSRPHDGPDHIANTLGPTGNTLPTVIQLVQDRARLNHLRTRRDDLQAQLRRLAGADVEPFGRRPVEVLYLKLREELRAGAGPVADKQRVVELIEQYRELDGLVVAADESLRVAGVRTYSGDSTEAMPFYRPWQGTTEEFDALSDAEKHAVAKAELSEGTLDFGDSATGAEYARTHLATIAAEHAESIEWAKQDANGTSLFGYSAVNRYVATPYEEKTTDDPARPHVPHLDAAILSNRTTADSWVVAETVLDSADNADPASMRGQLCDAPGYLCGEMGSAPSARLQDSDVVHLRVPAGTPLLGTESVTRTSEVVLMRGTRYVITRSFADEDGLVHAYGYVLADEWGPIPGSAEDRTRAAPYSIGSRPSHSAADPSSPNGANALNRARGEWITARRDDKGRRDSRTMTAADLARAVGVNRSTMSRIEQGSTRPRPGLFVKIGRALGVPRSEFLVAARNLYPDADFDLTPTAYPLDAPGRWLSAMLNDRDMSWEELAEASGISAKYLSSIGKGETVPGAAVFRTLGEALHLGSEAIGPAADHFFPGTTADLAPTAYAPEERGLWLRAHRADRGISVEDLAQDAGIDTEYLRSVERAERHLGVVDFLSLCKALGLGRQAIDAAADRFFPGVRVGLDPTAYTREERGRWLRAVRYDLGMSPEAVAAAAGISTIHLRSIELGERAPGVVVFLRICDALGIEPGVTGRAAGQFYPEARFEQDWAAYTSAEQGLWLRALRYHHRLQRSDVAGRAGLTEKYIGQIERGERIPSRHTFRLLGQELGISPIDLAAAEDHFFASALTDVPGLRFDDLTAGNEAQADLVERQIVELLEGWSDPAYVREIAAAVGASIRWGQGHLSLRAEFDADAVHVDLVDITADNSYVRVEWRLGRTPGPVERAAEPPVERSSEELDLDRLMEMFGDSGSEEPPPYQREVRRIRNAVEARLLEYDGDISGDMVDSIMRAVSELVTNAKKHLYSNASSAGLAPEEVLDLTIRGAGDDRQVHVVVANEIASGVATKLPKWTPDEQDVDREGGRGTQLVVAESTVAVRRIIGGGLHRPDEGHTRPGRGDCGRIRRWRDQWSRRRQPAMGDPPLRHHPEPARNHS
ncbi:helix-turn-helix domain-containing protein [Nocardia carnea]|uniref:helix-turn-helix domain-containing protein n=1 Tax=Nocardia carnea TaxID=37328 RepID=UPI0002F72605|nr:helix-turn-helix domain-containing protein [Nocardia carnea]